jgi:hypothetical protein
MRRIKPLALVMASGLLAVACARWGLLLKAREP